MLGGVWPSLTIAQLANINPIKDISGTICVGAGRLE